MNQGEKGRKDGMLGKKRRVKEEGGRQRRKDNDRDVMKKQNGEREKQREGG